VHTPDLESLRCFEAVARHLHFRTAADSVALSPTAFSERIRKLEEDLGTPLLERTTRRVTLTPAGHRLLPHVQRLLEDARRLRQVVSEAAPMPFELVLGTRFELGLSWLVPSLGVLEARRPERTLHLRFGDSADLLQAVRTGTVDAAVTSVRLTTPGLAYAPLHEETYVFVGSPHLPPLGAPEDAAHHTLLDTQPDLPLFRYLLDAVTPPAAWPFARMVWLGTIAAIRHRVLEGAGVAVLPRYFVTEDVAQGRLVRLLPELPLSSDRFRLVWRRDHPLHEALFELAGDLRALPVR
jgi:LysR family glycine cleavage system transcriptional activator